MVVVLFVGGLVWYWLCCITFSCGIAVVAPNQIIKDFGLVILLIIIQLVKFVPSTYLQIWEYLDEWIICNMLSRSQICKKLSENWLVEDLVSHVYRIFMFKVIFDSQMFGVHPSLSKLNVGYQKQSEYCWLKRKLLGNFRVQLKTFGR